MRKGRDREKPPNSKQMKLSQDYITKKKKPIALMRDGCWNKLTWDFDDLLVRAVNAMERFEEVRDHWRRYLSPRPRRRVPGHQPRPVPVVAAARLRARQPDGRRRLGPVCVRVQVRRHPHLGFSRTTSPTLWWSSSSRTTAPPRRSSAANAVVERNRERLPKRLWTESAGGEPVQLAELARRARGGALGGGRDRATRRGGGEWSAPRSRSSTAPTR